MKVWDHDTGKERHTLRGHAGAVFTLAATPTGRTLVSGGAGAGLRVWDMSSGRLQSVLTGHNHAITSLAMDVKGRFMLSASLDGTVLRWPGVQGDEARAVLRKRATRLHPAGRAACGWCWRPRCWRPWCCVRRRLRWSGDAGGQNKPETSTVAWWRGP